MAGRGAQTFKKRQKEQERKEKQAEKFARRLARKTQDPAAEETYDEFGNVIDSRTDDGLETDEPEGAEPKHDALAVLPRDTGLA